MISKNKVQELEKLIESWRIVDYCSCHGASCWHDGIEFAKETCAEELEYLLREWKTKEDEPA